MVRDWSVRSTEWIHNRPNVFFFQPRSWIFSCAYMQLACAHHSFVVSTRRCIEEQVLIMKSSSLVPETVMKSSSFVPQTVNPIENSKCHGYLELILVTFLLLPSWSTWHINNHMLIVNSTNLYCWFNLADSFALSCTWQIWNPVEEELYKVC